MGTCGFAERHADTFRDFAIVEIQSTFYQPPRLSTVERWRRDAPSSFSFSLKAWQLITHAGTSPTYRRLKEALSEYDRARCGDFRWNALTRMAWSRIEAVADALAAEAIIFQTPASFAPSEGNLRRVCHFFEQIERHGRRLVFEPRGAAWTDEILAPLIGDLDLIHGVDPFLRPPAENAYRYFRLHGRPAYNYRYRYTDDDLLQLLQALNWHGANRVLFNTIHMAEDAKRFLRLIRAKSLTGV